MAAEQVQEEQVASPVRLLGLMPRMVAIAVAQGKDAVRRCPLTMIGPRVVR
jgi:hypothetical protein